MTIRYERAPELQAQVSWLARALRMPHVNERVGCIRSYGSRSRNTIARVHGMDRIMTAAFDIPVHYVIEVISEKYDRQPYQEKIKTLIHEMLHVPVAFGGGYRQHDLVTEEVVDRLYERLEKEGTLPPPAPPPPKPSRKRRSPKQRFLFPEA